MQYRHVDITKDYRGFYKAEVAMYHRRTGIYYMQPAQADTLAGIRRLIRFYKAYTD